jgi:predicted N-acetyltransferase YhbS
VVEVIQPVWSAERAAAGRYAGASPCRGGPTDSEIAIRRSDPSDQPQILRLLEASLRWVPDEQHAAFLAWKHDENPFGRSPAWVATAGDRVVGFRTFLRWEFDHDGRRVRAVRAVDTATHPEFQGRGIFSKLTLLALDDLRADGVDFVFNTPNNNSRPGYLKMGWIELTRVGIAARPRRWLTGLPKMARARGAASRWSPPTSVGAPAGEVLQDHAAVEALLDSQPGGKGLRTHRSPEFFHWRYRFGPLGYRAVLAGSDLRDGLVLFRLRHRGKGTEAGVCDVLVPGDEPAAVDRLLRKLRAESGADYLVLVPRGGRRPRGFLPIPGAGPILTWRALCQETPPRVDELQLVAGDVELF